MPDFIYLASQSPRRRQLLEQLGVRHELLLPNVEGDESEDAEAIEVVLPGEAPTAYVERVTGLKLDAAVARRARRGLPDAPILCSDTTVALGRTIYGKPDDAAHAARIIDWAVADGLLFVMELMEHATQRPFVYSHEWRDGDFVIWDNLATMHRATAFDDAVHHRELRRVTTIDVPLVV